MTTPRERTRAVIELGIAVRELAPYTYGRTPTVRVPREHLRVLLRWLRHYPTPSELWMSADAAPHLWSESEHG